MLMVIFYVSSNICQFIEIYVENVHNFSVIGFPFFICMICFWLFSFQGPLFQQRPYPSPGAVLRKNAEFASQKKRPNSNFAPISKRGDGSDGLGDADWPILSISFALGLELAFIVVFVI